MTSKTAATYTYANAFTYGIVIILNDVGYLSVFLKQNNLFTNNQNIKKNNPLFQQLIKWLPERLNKVRWLSFPFE